MSRPISPEPPECRPMSTETFQAQKVYIAMHYGPFTESHIIGVCHKQEDAEQLASEDTMRIQATWNEIYGADSPYPDSVMLSEGPYDTTGVVEIEVQ